MSFPPCERRWLVRDEGTWKEIWLADREFPKGYLESFMTTTQRPSKRTSIRTETLWFYRHVRDSVWKQLWCSGESRPCQILIDVEQEYDTLTTREITLGPKIQHTLYFVKSDLSFGDLRWSPIWIANGEHFKLQGKLFYKTTTEELR